MERSPAHAGLSFVHFQAAFMHYEDDIAGKTALARRFAERGLELDPLTRSSWTPERIDSTSAGLFPSELSSQGR